LTTKVVILAALLACALAEPAHPRALPGPIEDLQPGQWYEVPNSRLRDVLPDPLPPGNPTAIMAAWSGGAYDTKRDRLIVWGGGHGDYGGNELYAFDVNALSWSRLWGPSPDIPPRGGRCSETYSDGNPASRHTYGGLQYLPNIDRLWNSGGSLWCGSGGASAGIWTFDFTTLSWERRAKFPGLAELEHASAYDPVSGHVFFANVAAPLFEYDPIGNSWAPRGDKALGHDKNVAIDPKRRKFVAVGGGEVFVYDLRFFGYSRKTVTTTGETAIIKARYPGLVYDPVSDRLVAWSGGSDVYSLETETMAWTKRGPSGSVVPSVATATGTHGRWQYIPSKNAFIGVNSIDENVFIYKLTPGPGRRTSSTTGSSALSPRVRQVGNVAQAPTPSVPTTQIDIPLKQWVALAAPPAESGKGIPSGNKHVNAAYHPPSARIYFTGGDYAGGGGFPTDSYRQETWSLSIAERFGNVSDPAAGWRLEYPYCGPPEQIQPKHPDYVGWVWDPKRSLFYLVPGVMDSTTESNCPGETPDKQTNPGFISGRMMSFDPVARRWAIVGSGDPGPDPSDSWQSILDPVTDTIHRFGVTMRANRYNIASRRWSVSGMPPLNIWKEYLAADIEGRAVYAIDGLAGRLHRYNIDSGSFKDLGPIPGGSLRTTNQTYLAWDSLNKVLFWHKEGTAFFAYHPQTRGWETLSIASNVSGVNARGRLLIYDPGQNALLLFGGSDTGTPYIFLYRYGTGPGTPPRAAAVDTGFGRGPLSASE
jgi:hypothetical protein